MSKPTYRGAIVGVGATANSRGKKGGGHQIGYTHAEMYERSSRCTLAAAADINAENLAAFAERFKVQQPFGSYQQMLADARPDIVSICTYVGLHRPMIEAAVAAGVRGIVCEKPFLNSPADIAAIRDLVAKSGVKIVVAHIRRYMPCLIRAKEIYQSGEVGQPLCCLAGIDGWDLSEWGSHWLDIFRFFHNDQPAQWVMGQARVGTVRGYGHAMEDHASAYMEFEGGGRALLDGGRPMAGDASITLVGTAGVVRLLGGGNPSALRVEAGGAVREESFKDNPANGWNALWDAALADLVQWLDGGPAPQTSAENIFATSELNLGAYLSAWKRDRIDLPLSGDLLKVDRWPVELLAPGA